MDIPRIIELPRPFPGGWAEEKIEFQAEDYLRRLQALRSKMEQRRYTHLLIYADREHFANMMWLIGHDPRFEQALLLLPLQGEPTLFLGNEGMGYSYDVLVPIRRVSYQNFSLQGQPRESLRPLAVLLNEAGLTADSQLGVVGFKYFYPEHLADARQRYDLPAYIIDELREILPSTRMENATDLLTGMPDGLRLRLNSAREIAHYEYIASRCSERVLRMIKALKPGLSEVEVSIAAANDGLPQHVHPMINFGPEHIASGIRSPNDRRLQLGEVAGLCLGPRGALVSRVGVAAYDEGSLQPQLAGSIEGFYGRHWLALTVWYESLYLGVTGGEVYANLQPYLEGLNVYLNPGHYIEEDEWVNAPMFAGSQIPLVSGAYLQSDVIASSPEPVRTAIMEDGIVLADAELRQQLAAEYPRCWQRIAERQSFMREVLGIAVRDEVLPLSNLCGIYFPFMLDCSRIFAK